MKHIMDVTIDRLIDGEIRTEHINMLGVLNIVFDPIGGGKINISASEIDGTIRISTDGALGITCCASNVILVRDENWRARLNRIPTTNKLCSKHKE